MHVRLVAVDCSAEPWALDWVRVLAFVCAWSKASECVDVAESQL